MKVLSLQQPWASWVAAGFKTIETRSWSTKHRGELAIAATAKVPDWKAAAANPNATSAAMHLHASQACESGIPRGVIVATCKLVDVVPIRPYSTINTGREFRPYVMFTQSEAATWPAAWLDTPDGRSTGVSDQLPYGDFTPGRFAWLLADVEPVDPPIPFKGGQGLTRSWDGVRA